MKYSDHILSEYDQELNYTLLIYPIIELVDTNYWERISISDSKWKRLIGSIAGRYKGLGVYHSHHKQRLGGAYSPHVHVVLHIPEDEQQEYEQNLDKYKSRVDKKNHFIIAPNNGERKVKNICKFVAYLLGERRLHNPELKWQRR